MNLDDDSRELLQEVVHIGVGRAGQALSSLTQNHVSFDQTQITHLDPAGLEATLHHPDGTISVFIDFDGKVAGSMLLLLSRPNAAELVGFLTGAPTPHDCDFATEATLGEIANILNNAVMGSVANQITANLNFSVPLFASEAEAKTKLLGVDDQLTLASSRLSTDRESEGPNVEVHLLLAFKNECQPQLERSLSLLAG